MILPARLNVEIEELRLRGATVDLVTEASRHFVIVRDFLLPGGYDRDDADVMIMADYLYPMSALDMFWTFPHVRCQSGLLPQNADQYCDFIGINWQRWSYHYLWNPACHSLLTHLDVFDARLATAP